MKLRLKLCQVILVSCMLTCLSVQAAPTSLGAGCRISDTGTIFWPARADGRAPGTGTLRFDSTIVLTGRDFDGRRVDFTNLRRCFFRTEAELTKPDSTCDLATPEITASPEIAYIAMINESTLEYCAYKYSVDFARADPRFNGAVVFPPPRSLPARAPILKFEEPINGRVSNGIANVRGWIVSDIPITRIDLYLDGALVGVIPYGGKRPLVGNAYPSFPNSDKSGFSMVYGFSNLSHSAHSMTVKAYAADTLIAEQTNTFTVAGFDSAFIEPRSPIDLSEVSFTSPSLGHHKEGLKHFYMNGAILDGVAYDLLFEWNSATQKFEITEVHN